MFDNGRRAATGTESEQVVALAGVLQRALTVTRESRSRYDLDRAARFGEQRGLLVCGAAIGASIDAAQDGAERVRRLGRALEGIRRLGVRFPVRTLGADRGWIGWRWCGLGVAVRSSAVRLRSAPSRVHPGYDGSVLVHDTHDVLNRVR
jgi:hypothetical protein